MSAPHGNLSVFVPHAGCPNQCIFCEQHRISGAQHAPTPDEVRALCDTYLPRGDCGEMEIAFFGGSFTAIDPAYRRALLEAAHPFVKAGRAKGIRISTRPDAISGEILTELRSFGVGAIELGAQSMDDAVLAANRRGHTAKDVEKACEAIHAFGGFSLGFQMMVGMYGEKDARAAALHTARAFCTLRPDTVRIYPTLVVENTPLHDLWRAGDYKPLEVCEAADICAQLIGIFREQGIRILRVGLHGDEGLRGSAAAGPFHPAFGELCYGRVFRKETEALLRDQETGTYLLRVNPRDVSRAVGHKGENKRFFENSGYILRVRGDETCPEGTLCFEKTDK